MEYWIIAIIVKPFALFFLAAAVLYPSRVLVQNKMRPGKLKSLLLRRVN